MKIISFLRSALGVARRAPPPSRGAAAAQPAQVSAERKEAAEKLARPAVLLKRLGDPTALAGIWGGPGVVPAPSESLRHWISVDCRFLPVGLGPTNGVLSVYTDDDEFDGGIAVHDPARSLDASRGTPLFAHPARSLPPPDVFGDEVDEDYERWWQPNCPLYTGEAVAVLGGWHFPWPDGDWEDLRKSSLLVWTFDDAEPWLEVWHDAGGFRVVPRIT